MYSRVWSWCSFGWIFPLVRVCSRHQTSPGWGHMMTTVMATAAVFVTMCSLWKSAFIPAARLVSGVSTVYGGPYRQINVHVMWVLTQKHLIKQKCHQRFRPKDAVLAFHLQAAPQNRVKHVRGPLWERWLRSSELHRNHNTADWLFLDLRWKRITETFASGWRTTSRKICLKTQRT